MPANSSADVPTDAIAEPSARAPAIAPAARKLPANTDPSILNLPTDCCAAVPATRVEPVNLFSLSEAFSVAFAILRSGALIPSRNIMKFLIVAIIYPFFSFSASFFFARAYSSTNATTAARSQSGRLITSCGNSPHLINAKYATHVSASPCVKSFLLFSPYRPCRCRSRTPVAPPKVSRSIRPV